MFKLLAYEYKTILKIQMKAFPQQDPTSAKAANVAICFWRLILIERDQIEIQVFLKHTMKDRLNNFQEK